MLSKGDAFAMFNDKVFAWLFAFYLGLSPIYWVPHVPALLFVVVKWFLFACICLFGFFSAFRRGHSLRFAFPGEGYSFAILVAMLSIVVSYLLLGNNERSLNSAINFLQIILFLMATSVLIRIDKVFFVIKASLWILSFFVFLSVILMLYTPFVVSPFNAKMYLIDTGFGGARTGWSPSIGLFLPFLVMLSGGLVFIFVYLFSQLLTGGRAGFYLSVVAVPILLFYGNTWRAKSRHIVFLAVIFAVVFLYNPGFFDGYRVFDSLTSDSSADEFSSGRVSLLEDAWSSILESPFLGNASDPHFPGENVHNVFVKGWVYYGLLYFILSILIVAYGILKAILRVMSSEDKSNKKFFTILSTVLISGFFVGMVEPSIIFGNFTTFSIWWFSFALVGSKHFFVPARDSF